MNERIKELAKQAGLSASATYAQGPDEIWLKEYNKKFAELIVQEFQTWVKETYLKTEPEHRACLLELDAKIEEQFGVK